MTTIQVYKMTGGGSVRISDTMKTHLGKLIAANGIATIDPAVGKDVSIPEVEVNSPGKLILAPNGGTIHIGHLVDTTHGTGITKKITNGGKIYIGGNVYSLI